MALKRTGARTGKSVVVTIRLDPRLDYICELIAASKRLPKSQLIETAIDEKLARMVSNTDQQQEKADIALRRFAEKHWHPDEIERLRLLVVNSKHLMSTEQSKIWALLQYVPRLWRGIWENHPGNQMIFKPGIEKPENLIVSRVHQVWQTLVEFLAEFPDFEMTDVSAREWIHRRLPTDEIIVPRDEQLSSSVMPPEF